MNKSYFYTCKHCYKEYKPTKRGRQKFCSDSCRSSNHQIKKKLKLKQESSDRLPLTKSKEIETPKVNLPYIINSAIGSVGANFIKDIATPKHKKAVTKQDFENLKKSYFGGRYRPVLNCLKNNIGETPYFDLELNKVIFSFDKLV